MRIKILTIPRQEHRVWALLGHLQTVGFPVRKRDKVSVYRGFDYRDYDSDEHFYKAVLLRSGIKEELFPVVYRSMKSLMIECGIYLILKEVVKEGEPCIFLENDAYFEKVWKPDMDYSRVYDALLDEWETLKQAVGYKNIKMVQLFCKPLLNMDIGILMRRDEKPIFREREPVTDFFVKGVRGSGQVGMIFTPHGAEWVLENKPLMPHMEVYINENPDIDGLYGVKDSVITHEFYSNFDGDALFSFHDGYNMHAWFKHYRGQDLLSKG